MKIDFPGSSDARASQIAIASHFDLQPLNEFLTNHVDPFVIEWDASSLFPERIFHDLHTMGVIGAGLLAKHGGRELPMIDLLSIANELAYHSPGIFSSWIGNMLAQTAVSRFGREEIATKVCADHLTTKTLMSFCATEYETGTDVNRMITRANQVDGGYELFGRKHYITNINHATHLVVFARLVTADGTPESGFSAFYVPANAPGVMVGKPLSKLGQRESNTGQVEFERVRIPENYLLGNPGDGYHILASCISRTKTLISGASVGVCRRAESEAMAYLTGVQRYGEPLLARKEVQNLLTSLHARQEAAWLLACKAGAAWDQKGIANYEASLAKYFAADAAVEFVGECLELTGASGYMSESFLSKLHRDVKLFEIYEGATFVQQALFGKELYGPALKKARSGPARKVA